MNHLQKSSILIDLDRIWLRVKKNQLFALYTISLILLTISVAIEGGVKSVFILLFYIAIFVSVYFMLSEKQQNLVIRLMGILSRQTDGDKSWQARLLLALSVVFVGAQFIHLGYIPALFSSIEPDYYNVMFIRQAIFLDEGLFFSYGSNFIIKAILPFLMLYFLTVKSRVEFFITLAVGSLYAISLMNKLFIVIVFAPTLIYFLIRKEIFGFIFLSVVPAIGIATLIYIQNPQIRPLPWVNAAKLVSENKNYNSYAENVKKDIIKTAFVVEVKNTHIDLSEEALKVAVLDHFKERWQAENNSVKRVENVNPFFAMLETIYLRVFIVPGQVVTAWFKHIPSEIPYAHGCGYRLMAKILGCDFVVFSALINDIENPHLAEMGVHGTMTAASFMEDYANFGVYGVVLGAVIMGGLISLVSTLFSRSWEWGLALNSIPLMLLMEGALTTTLLTGGWVLNVLLYTYFVSGNKKITFNKSETS